MRSLKVRFIRVVKVINQELYPHQRRSRQGSALLEDVYESRLHCMTIAVTMVTCQCISHVFAETFNAPRYFMADPQEPIRSIKTISDGAIVTGSDAYKFGQSLLYYTKA